MSGQHKRNTSAMHASRRCGAKTRKGLACAAPAVHGKERCRMHGGRGSGAPVGNKNAQKSGLYSREFLESERAARALLRLAGSFLKKL